MATSKFGFVENTNSGTHKLLPRKNDIVRVDRIILGPTLANGEPDPAFEIAGKWAGIGAIVYSPIYGSTTSIVGATGPLIAMPINSTFRHYPVVGELVRILTGPSTDLNESPTSKFPYYTSPYNLWNTVHHNAFPNPLNYSTQTEGISNSYKDITQGAKFTNDEQSTAAKLGQTFTEKSDIKIGRAHV